MPTLHHKSKQQVSYLPTDLATARFVFVRVDAVRRPLVRPYEGPFKVIRAGPKVFAVLKNGKEWNVSIDRLKVAPDPLDRPSAPFQASFPVPSSCVPDTVSARSDPVLRRSGRQVRPPERLEYK